MDATQWFSRPISYEQVILEQLQRLAQDARGEIPTERTIANVLILSILTIIDTLEDKEYQKEIDEIKKIEADYIEANRINPKTGKENSEIFIEAQHRSALSQFVAIMKSLKRAGRFPARAEVSFEGENDTPELNQ
jgi:hypothetical protein